MKCNEGVVRGVLCIASCYCNLCYLTSVRVLPGLAWAGPGKDTRRESGDDVGLVSLSARQLPHQLHTGMTSARS